MGAVTGPGGAAAPTSMVGRLSCAEAEAAKERARAQAESAAQK